VIIINISIIDVDLVIFKGEKEFDKFNKTIKADLPLKAGYSVENYIWWEGNNKRYLIHEIMHFLDWLYSYFAIEEEHEFKAYLGEYVISSALKRFKI
jgi:hypothetical protein